MNLEPQSHFLIAAYMSWIESLQGWGKLVSVFGHLDLLKYEISYLKAA
jgi:hypothetical protein